MALTLTIELTDLEEKCLKSCMADVQEWAEHFVKHRARVAMLEIYEREVQRLKSEGADSIPLDAEKVVEAMNVPPAMRMQDMPSPAATYPLPPDEAPQ